MMSCTPLRPRSTGWRRNADQPDLSSLAPSQMPRIFRKPSELTALATTRVHDRLKPKAVGSCDVHNNSCCLSRRELELLRHDLGIVRMNQTARSDLYAETCSTGAA
jgi:hypothetical protein